MKIQYIRKLTASYMVLAQCEELQEWEKKMIAHAPKGNIVFAECVQENGEKYLWYNITGKQALDAVLETETYTLLPDSRRLSPSCPPGVQNLTALSIRL